MVTRTLERDLRRAAAEYPVVTILGPRQSGKTTLARMTFPEKRYFSLEDPDTRAAAEVDPRGFLDAAPDGAILDEVQRLPILLSYLQGIVDSDRVRGRYILTGSHQPELHAAIAQSLAGRTAVLTLWPFALDELRHYGQERPTFDRIVRGCFPRVHEEGLEPRRFFNGYVQTYVERDVRALLQVRDLAQFQKFMVLLAGRTGQLLNLQSLASDVGVSAMTARRWLSVLQATYIVFELPPYFANLRKRLVRSPKVYFTDVGLASFLLGIHTGEQAARDPARGALYENFVVTEIMKGALNRGLRPVMSFYRDHDGLEIDVLIREGGRLVPVEIKSASTFHPGVIAPAEKFRSLAVGEVTPGFVLYDGRQSLNVRGVGVFNPLDVPDLWKTLTAAPD